jgi:hypothetical protein
MSADHGRVKTDPAFLRTLRSARPRTVRLGYSGLALFSARALNEGQVGYSRHPEGRDLTGRAPGAWRASWLVIGNELLSGEPIFVDLAKPGIPVYTAMHGQGEWNPARIAKSFDGFVLGLREMEAASRGRKHPVALEKQPLGKAERRELIRRLRCLGGPSEHAFWLSWFQV